MKRRAAIDPALIPLFCFRPADQLFPGFGRGLAHAHDERPDLIALPFFEDEAETLDDDLAPLMPPSYVIQVAVYNVAGRFWILRNQSRFGKPGFFISLHDLEESGPNVCNAFHDISFHALPSSLKFIQEKIA
jgi:hypothetical protein